MFAGTVPFITGSRMRQMPKLVFWWSNSEIGGRDAAGDQRLHGRERHVGSDDTETGFMRHQLGEGDLVDVLTLAQ